MSLLTKDALIDLAAGWCSGTAALIVCQPVDTILTRSQAGSTLVVDTLSTRQLITTSGITKLWRGALPMIGAVPLQNALLMAGYGLGKRSDSNWGVFIGGCTGGVVQSFLMSPVELIKVHQQVNVRAVLGTSNVRQLLPSLFSPLAWKGLGATLLRDGIPHGIWFVSYELAKDYLGKLVPNGDSYHTSLTVPLVSGAFAATAAWVRYVTRVLYSIVLYSA
jgi:solute carrier family 25 carnitine/acylcarnitine transporter 20/29